MVRGLNVRHFVLTIKAKEPKPRHRILQLEVCHVMASGRRIEGEGHGLRRLDVEIDVHETRYKKHVHENGLGQ